MTRAEAIAKANKIHALVVGGATEGERAAAKNRLDAVMKAHSLTEADLGIFRTHSQNAQYKNHSGANSQHNQPYNSHRQRGDEGVKPDYESVGKLFRLLFDFYWYHYKRR